MQFIFLIRSQYPEKSYQLVDLPTYLPTFKVPNCQSNFNNVEIKTLKGVCNIPTSILIKYISKNKICNFQSSMYVIFMAHLLYDSKKASMRTGSINNFAPFSCRFGLNLDVENIHNHS